MNLGLDKGRSDTVVRESGGWPIWGRWLYKRPRNIPVSAFAGLYILLCKVQLVVWSRAPKF